ncbi:hypothetical protein Fmac_012737 [Flemingia macrophylla]|uniref:CLAVATA3/ESR (CLE)-related protein 13 n=1 Tax=Flemingia macrophylla TaxID=520843 RepID=A0ABD1MR50_9FABA
MALIIRFQHLLCFTLCLFLFSLLFHGFFSFKSNSHTTNFSPNRKTLASSQGFDFTPFLHRRHHHHSHHPHHHHRSHTPEPSRTQVDPRYGVEKRLVPTGPNPLHH